MRYLYSLYPIKDAIVCLRDEVVDILLDYRQSSKNEKESGGVLIGYLPKEGEDVIVTSISIPQLGDCCGLFWFYRSKQHNKIVKKEWEQSDFTRSCVGVWHTHPEPNPAPSWTDIADWKKVLRHSVHGDVGIFMIVGQRYINLWTFTPNGKLVKLAKLKDLS